MSQFISDDSVKANMGYVLLLKKMWRYIRRHLFLFFTSIFLILALAVVSRTLPLLIGKAIDVGIETKSVEGIKQIAYIYLLMVILQTVFQLSYQWVFQFMGNRVLFYLREDLVRHVQRLPMQYFNKTPVGRIITRLTNDVANLGDLFTEGVITIFVEVVMMVAIIITMFVISWKLALATLITAPLFIGLSFWLSDRYRDILRDTKKKLSQMTSYVAENINGIKVIQLYNRVPRNLRTFGDLSNDYRNLTLRSVRASALLMPVINLLTAVTVTSALSYGGYLALIDVLSVGMLVAFINTVQDFIPPLREILEKYQQFQNSLTSAERVFQVFDEQEEIGFGDAGVAFGGTALQAQREKAAADLHTLNGTQEPLEASLNGEIEFKNLSFRYESHLPDVLKNINVAIQPGQSIALVGRTGSGKTTFVSLLQRFYEAPKGTILIDNKSINSYPKEYLRSHIGSVQQDNFIFRGTVRENIGLMDKSISDEQIERASQQVGHFDLLERTGRNLDSWVEERGSNLSVGERQLLAFARILAFQPDVLILDEATANIDSQSERLIQAATTEVTKGRTSLIIAHRLSTIQACDLILVFQKGEIIERGNHAQLVAQNGYYAELARRGFADELNDDGTSVSKSPISQTEISQNKNL